MDQITCFCGSQFRKRADGLGTNCYNFLVMISDDCLLLTVALLGRLAGEFFLSCSQELDFVFVAGVVLALLGGGIRNREGG